MKMQLSGTHFMDVNKKKLPIVDNQDVEKTVNKSSKLSKTNLRKAQLKESKPAARIDVAKKSAVNGKLVSSTKAASRTLLNIATGTVFAIPEAAGLAVGTVAAVFYGTLNITKVKKNKKTKEQAIKDTMISSSGVGVSAGLGVAAGGIVAEAMAGTVAAETAIAGGVAAEVVAGATVAGTAFPLVATIAIPVVAGIAVSCCSMKIWNKLFKKDSILEEPVRSSNPKTGGTVNK